MKHYRTIEVPAIYKKLLYKTTCDMCNREITRDCGDLQEVEIRYRTGVRFPECSCGELVSADICGDCFKNTVRPLLESKGVEFTETDWES